MLGFFIEVRDGLELGNAVDLAGLRGKKAFAAAPCVCIGTAGWSSDKLWEDIACVLVLTKAISFSAQELVCFY